MIHSQYEPALPLLTISPQTSTTPFVDPSSIHTVIYTLLGTHFLPFTGPPLAQTSLPSTISSYSLENATQHILPS